MELVFDRKGIKNGVCKSHNNEYVGGGVGNRNICYTSTTPFTSYLLYILLIVIYRRGGIRGGGVVTMFLYFLLDKIN